MNRFALIILIFSPFSFGNVLLCKGTGEKPHDAFATTIWSAFNLNFKQKSDAGILTRGDLSTVRSVIDQQHTTPRILTESIAPKFHLLCNPQNSQAVRINYDLGIDLMERELTLETKSCAIIKASTLSFPKNACNNCKQLIFQKLCTKNKKQIWVDKRPIYAKPRIIEIHGKEEIIHGISAVIWGDITSHHRYTLFSSPEKYRLKLCAAKGAIIHYSAAIPYEQLSGFTKRSNGCINLEAAHVELDTSSLSNQGNGSYRIEFSVLGKN
ncbi:hypothetical protein ACPV40_01020 [Vibrio alfacsensis]|uniref:hypothetical protein n=1 Tax=Vibrio alfacsensis TaxID=1074311 RepID=UPI004068F291